MAFIKSAFELKFSKLSSNMKFFTSGKVVTTELFSWKIGIGKVGMEVKNR